MSRCHPPPLQIWTPRIFQALLAAFADVKFFFLIRTLENRDTATWTVSTFRCILSLAGCALQLGVTFGELWPFLSRCTVLLLPVLVVLMVLLHQNSDQQHGDHHHLPGSFLLPAPGVQNTQQVFGPNIFLTSLLKCRFLYWFIGLFVPVRNTSLWSPWPSSSGQPPWFSGFLCFSTIFGRKMTNWNLSLTHSFPSGWYL